VTEVKATQVDPAFEALLEYLRDSRAFDFTGYKRQSLMRRVGKRMETLRFDGYDGYRGYLEEHEEEFVHLFNTILINVTGFFRDRPAWDFLQAEIVPKIVASKGDDETIRIWSTGCASGEEAYTLAMVFAEALGKDAFRKRVKIYATDVDDEALAEARHGSYPAKKVEEVPPEYAEKYFERTDGRSVFHADLRRAVIFGRHDLVQDPPISRIDLLSSRNTLMYFTPEAQSQILRNFHFALQPHGYLFLGKSEILLTRTSLFVPVDMRRRIFQKVGAATAGYTRPYVLPAAVVEATPEAVRDATFELSPVAQFVVDKTGNVVLANQQARSLFGLTLRDLSRPLQDLEVSYRPVELRSQIERVYAGGRAVNVRGIEWRTPRGEDRTFDVTIVPIVSRADGEPTIAATGISFTDVTRFAVLQSDVEAAKRSADSAYEELQSTFDELETTNEELQSTNEELETTNEELQSSNEELETMNEELQSTNEELETINDEVNQRTVELDAANAFLESILASIDAGVIVVDNELRIIAWNGASEQLWGVRRDEAVGQHLLTLDSGLPVDELRTALRSAIDGGGESSEVVVDGTNRRGKRVRCKVVASPLRRAPSSAGQGAILFLEVVAE
jgi:two-component system CheB/CheR fusion protein